MTNTNIVPAMHEVDFVVVPSRREYPEAVPITIYEALASRTPLIVSDHPMFVPNIIDQESVLVFRAGDASNLAENLDILATRPDLYARLAAVGPKALESLRLPVEWTMLIDHWIADRE